MIVGRRILERLQVVQLSQSELARRVGMSQSAMNNLIAGRSRSSTKLHAIARELRTTPAYLSGEINDADEGAPPPPRAATVQFVPIMAALPSEDALAAGFSGLLLASPGLSGDDLARELAKRLPLLLRVAAGAIAGPEWQDRAAAPEGGDAPARALRERRRA